MNKTEVKTEIKKELENVIDLNIKVNSSLSDIIDNYLDYITKNVPEEYYNDFGVGIAGSHNQFGSTYGFKNDRLSHEDNVYSCIGSSYYIANDYNARVQGSNNKDLVDFASNVKKYIKEGMAKLSHYNELSQSLIEDLNFFNKLKK